MHKLDRTIATPPDSLSNYDYQTQTWKDLDPDCKKALRAALVKMQGIPEVTTPDADEYGLRCAYCECAIYDAGHIEHFRRKNRSHFPELTFVWDNLFLACGSQSNCGHYKDRNAGAPYNPDHLIKPDTQDPEQYLYFHSTGQVRPQQGLNENDKHCAEETIRVFGLNSSLLSGARRSSLITYKNKILEELNEISEWSETDRVDYLMEEIEATRWEPYSTTIKHFLQKIR
ncbi:retron system putative HNH endonuclease [Proteus terrae]|uniref:retron system putative HNH endonuclease n=1 Tax=Proteus terrae TaxID=1574161 RepID=UPI0032DB74CC